MNALGEYISREKADIYQCLFNFFHNEYGIILTCSEMNDIIQAVKKHNEQN